MGKAVAKSLMGELDGYNHSKLESTKETAIKAGGMTAERNIVHGGGCVYMEVYSKVVVDYGPMVTVLADTTDVDGEASSLAKGGRYSKENPAGLYHFCHDPMAASLYPKGYVTGGPGGVAKNTLTGTVLLVGKVRTYLVGKIKNVVETRSDSLV